MVAMNLNTNTYTIAIDATSKSATLNPQDANQSSLIISNNSTTAVFVVTGKDAAPTAVFPTSATAPLPGKVILAGAIVTLTKNIGDNYVSAIQASAGTGNLYISPGAGE